MYDSISPSLIQAHPPIGDWNANGWNSVSGWHNEAKRLWVAITINRPDLVWHATLNIGHHFDAAEIKKLWKQIARNLNRKHIIAIFVRELDNDSHINYHLLIANRISEKALRRAIKASIPTGIKYSSTIRPIKHLRGVAKYICKARGWEKERIYFNIRLNKYGSVGDFWLTPKKTIWQRVIEQQRHLKRQLDDNPNISKAAAYLVDLTTGTGCRQRWFSQKYAERILVNKSPDMLAEFAQLWIEQEFPSS